MKTKVIIFLLFSLIFIVFLVAILTSKDAQIISNLSNLYIILNEKNEGTNLNKNIKNIIITQKGIASHYGTKFHRRKTASGERFDLFAHTAAHKRIPFGTIVKIINTENNLATLVKINDRGPFVRGRIIDLSHKAANMIKGFGNPDVEIQYIDNNMIQKNIDTNYFLGHSICKPFIIINKNAVNIIDSADNFEGVMNLYLNVVDTTTSYIFIKTTITKKQQKYFIGTPNFNIYDTLKTE